MVRKMLAALVGLAVFGMVGAAAAAPMTRAFTFSAIDFGDGVPGGDSAPVDPVTGTLILTFDPTVDSTNAAVDAGSIVNLNDPLPGLGTLGPGDLVFDYVSASDELTVGGTTDGASTVNLSVIDFQIIIEMASGTPTSGTVAYSDPSANGGNGAEFASEIVQISAVQIPEPGTLALFLTALLGLGFVVMRQQRQRPVEAPAFA